jgi:hypothetical protein
MRSLNIIKEEGSRELKVDKTCLEETCQSAMMQVMTTQHSNSDDDVEDDTYKPSPRARPHGKGLASASGSGAARDEEIEEEDDGADGDYGEGEEETFDVEEINPPNYVHMGTPIFRQPLNPD